MTPLEREACDLAMLVLQSDLYSSNTEVREQVDSILALSRNDSEKPERNPAYSYPIGNPAPCENSDCEAFGEPIPHSEHAPPSSDREPGGEK